MSEPMQNNAETHIGDNSNHDKGSGDQASCNIPPSNSRMPLIPSELANSIRNPNYWHTLVFELMNRIRPPPTGIPPKDDKLADRMARTTLTSMMESITKWNLKN